MVARLRHFCVVLTALPVIGNALQSRDVAGKSNLPEGPPESFAPYEVWTNHCPRNFGYTCDEVVGSDFSCLHLEEAGWDCGGCACNRNNPTKQAPMDITPSPTLATDQPLSTACPKNQLAHYSCDEALSSEYTCSSLEELGWDCGGCECIFGPNLVAEDTTKAAIETASAAATMAKNTVAWGGPILEKRCLVRDRIGRDWGDLGTRISKEECLRRCETDEACKFVSYKTNGNQQCTSFKSCDNATHALKHEIYTKTLVKEAATEAAREVATEGTTEVTTEATTMAKSAVAFRGPILEKRCLARDRIGRDWGDLGTLISKEECLKRCETDEACQFVSYKTNGTQQCTSFKSCDNPAHAIKHEIYYKILVKEVSTPTAMPTSAVPTLQNQTDEQFADTTDVLEDVSKEKSADAEVLEDVSKEDPMPNLSSCKQVNFGYSCDEKVGGDYTCPSLEELGWDCSGCACRAP